MLPTRGDKRQGHAGPLPVRLLPTRGPHQNSCAQGLPEMATDTPMSSRPVVLRRYSAPGMWRTTSQKMLKSSPTGSMLYRSLEEAERSSMVERRGSAAQETDRVIHGGLEASPAWTLGPLSRGSRQGLSGSRCWPASGNPQRKGVRLGPKRAPIVSTHHSHSELRNGPPRHARGLVAHQRHADHAHVTRRRVLNSIGLA